jgi:hypothetical protein
MLLKEKFFKKHINWVLVFVAFIAITLAFDGQLMSILFYQHENSNITNHN